MRPPSLPRTSPASWVPSIRRAIPGAIALVFGLPLAFNLAGFLSATVGDPAAMTVLTFLRHGLVLPLYGGCTVLVTRHLTDASVVEAGAITSLQRQALRLLCLGMLGVYLYDLSTALHWMAPLSTPWSALYLLLPTAFYACGLHILARLFRQLRAAQPRVPLSLLATLLGVDLLLGLGLLPLPREPDVTGPLSATLLGPLVLPVPMAGLAVWVLLKLKQACAGAT